MDTEKPAELPTDGATPSHPRTEALLCVGKYSLIEAICWTKRICPCGNNLSAWRMTSVVVVSFIHVPRATPFAKNVEKTTKENAEMTVKDDVGMTASSLTPYDWKVGMTDTDMKELAAAEDAFIGTGVNLYRDTDYKSSVDYRDYDSTGERLFERKPGEV